MSKNPISYWTKRWIFVLFILQGVFSPLISQNCSLESLYGDVMTIRDENTITLRIKVENSRINDLATDFQGVCGVRLNFRHGNLSDLVMTLTSPEGNSITLIGPADKNGTNPSPIVGVEHDISFVPGTTGIAFPDADLPENWTNNNINWGLNPPYTGSYFPFNGNFQSLEFKQGSVNGIWELTIEDAFINDEGLLRAFEIEFCDDSDIICSPCESRSGAFTEESLTICNGSLYDYSSAYMSDNFDTSIYDDQFLIYRDDALISYDLDTDFSLLSTGSYSIYGLNSSREELDSIRNSLESLSRLSMEEFVDSPGGAFCISRSEPLLIQINDPGDSIFMDTIVLCEDQVEVFRGDTISATGTYVFSSVLCDTIFLLPVIASELVIDPVIDTVYLDCLSGGAALSVAARSPDQIAYTWRDELGNILGVDSFLFHANGEAIILSVSDGICTRDFEIQVLNPADTMDVLISKSVSDLNCRDLTSLASISASFEIDRYTWWLGDSIVGTSESIILSQSGTYNLDILGINGCVIKDSVVINDLSSVPQAMILLDTIDCLLAEVDISVTSMETLDYSWLDGASQVLSDASIATITTGGDYRVRLTNSAFCDTTISFSILSDTASIRVANLPSEALLNCEVTTINLSPTFLGREVETVVWSNETEPNLSTDLTFNVNEPGVYTLVATAQNHCQEVIDIAIDIDTIAPDVRLSGGVITCSDPVLEVLALTSALDILYAWSGPFDNQTSDSSIQVSVPGLYTVGVLDTISECLTIDTILIQSDGDGPDINLVGDSVLNCVTTEIIVFNASLGLLNPKWSLPNGDSILGDSIIITEEGNYIFSATAANGCIGSSVWSVKEDRDIEPLILPDTVLITCTSPLINVTPSIPSSVRQIEWITGSNDTIRSGTFQVTSDGTLTIDAYYNNGCTEQYLIIVIPDTVSPNVNIINDTIDCNLPIVTIATATTNDRYEYNWMGAYDGRGDTSFVLVSRPEIITLRVTDNVNGCSASASVTVIEDIDALTPVIFRTVALACDIPVGRIDVTADQAIYVEWTDPDSMLFVSPEGIVDRPGPYSIRVIGENGCEFFTDWMVEDLREPVSVVLDTLYSLTCTQPEVTIEPSALEVGSIVQWIYTNGDTVTAARQDVGMGTQLESAYIVDADQCEVLIPLEFEVDTVALVADILIQDSTNCNGEDIDLLITEPQGVYDIRWLQDGVPMSAGGLSITAMNSGTYALEVTNIDNGCISVDTVVIRLSDLPIKGVGLELSDEICAGDMDGSFVLRNVIGGTGQLTYLFDNQVVVLDQDVFDLGPSAYQLNIEDELGCQWDTILTINPGVDYNIELGGDIHVNRGESILLTPNYSGSEPIINDISTIGQFNEISFDSIVFMPTSGGYINVVSTSIEGCNSIDSLFVNFDNNVSGIRLYIPNVLTPTLLGENSRLQVLLSDDIVSLDFFKIFDRWGQEIVSLSDIVSGDPILLWDGRFEGQFVEAGVYIYAYQITTILDGVKRHITGDITVIR